MSKPEDLEGMIIRSRGTSAEVIKAWGGTPQAMPMPEAYDALAKGVVDANFAYLETLKTWKHGDVVKYVTKFPVACSSCIFVAMNKDKWNSLPEDIQEVFTEVSEEFLEYSARAWVYLDKMGLELFLSLGEGREYIEIPQGERSVWLALVQPLLDRYVEEKTAMGLPAEEYFAYIEERTKYWAERQPTEEECVETVETELLK
ncbi:Solute-binding protein [subsurface metagenome]